MKKLLRIRAIVNQRVFRSVIAGLLCGVTIGIGFAQSSGGAPGTTGKSETSSTGSSVPVPGALVALDEDYRIGVNDVIEIQIEDATELSGAYRIAKSGTFLMPFLGRLTAQDKTPEELAKFIADGLRDRYLNNPTVRVVVRQYYHPACRSKTDAY